MARSNGNTWWRLKGKDWTRYLLAPPWRMLRRIGRGMLLILMRQKQLRVLGMRVLAGWPELKARLWGLADDRSDALSTADASTAARGGIDRLTEPARAIYASLQEFYDCPCEDWTKEQN